MLDGTAKSSGQHRTVGDAAQRDQDSNPFELLIDKGYRHSHMSDEKAP
jgi:hypothetical protein